MLRTALAFCFTTCLLITQGFAATVYSEPVDGELSALNLSPTMLNFMVGANTVSGTIEDAQGVGNIDVFSFVVPVGQELSSVTLNSYVSTDNVAFIGIENDSTFPYDSFELDQVDFGLLPVTAFLGGTTFGPTNAGNDILPFMGNVAGRLFTPPLGSDTYTIFLQQKGASTDYSFTFALNATAVPEPASTALLGLAGIGIAVVHRKRRRRVA